MSESRPRAAGGFAAVRYVLQKARSSGGYLALWKRLRSRNACKTCALGMGGQRGGMVDEAGHFPAVCKKSVQAVSGDLARAIPREFFERHSLEDLAAMGPRRLESAGRIAFPLLAESGDTHYRRIGWEEALRRAADAFSGIDPTRSFFYASGRSSNEAAFLLQLVARAFGSPHVNNCSYYCHQASGVALGEIYGSGTASVVLEDLRHADLALVVGANPASNHPRLITQLMELRRRGGEVIVVNPLRELGLRRFRVPSDPRSLLFGSEIASLYLQPHIGGDIALCKALLKGLIGSGALDEEFLRDHVEGFEAVRADIAASSWGELHAASGVDPHLLEEAVRRLARARRGIAMWAMGLTHHRFGVDNIQALANLVLARGWLGRPGAGMLPIRGHSNVQGVGSMGVTPSMKEAFARRMEELHGIRVPPVEGKDTYACMAAAHRSEIDAAFLLGGNLLGANPDSIWAEEALARIPFTVTVSTKLNTGHALVHGGTRLVLPALARDEEPQSTSQESMFNFVRLSEGGQAPPQGVGEPEGEARSEVEILASFAQGTLPPGRFDWETLRDHSSLREAIAASVPGYAAIGELDRGGPEFQIAGRSFHRPAFATPDGRAHSRVTPLPDWSPREGSFRLMTLRSEGQFNSVVYEDEDLYRGGAPRDALLISEDDLRALGLAEGDPVRVRSQCGEMRARAFAAEIRPGNLAMYYPEANVLVPRRLDPRSKTPAFKGVEVSVEPVGSERSEGSD